MTLLQTYQAALDDGTLHDDPAQRAVVPELDRIRAALVMPVKTGWFRRKPDPIKGLYIWGGVGRGKSMLMDMFARSVPNDGVLRVHFHAFMQQVHKDIAKARATGVTDAIVPVANAIAHDVRCLAFDEMQITDITDAMIVGRLFEKLFDADVVIVATSNRAPDDLYKDGLNRALFLPFIDQIKDKMVIWELTSDQDYRQNRLAGEPTYFHPLGPDTTTAMNTAWADLAGGVGGPLELTVNKRAFVIPNFRNGVARAGFRDLCGLPLGAADYLALAETTKVVVLDDVPILGRENANEAKRFVTLIDTLYEAKTQLIISAAAEPEALYPHGTGSFEFERTASRLREMQAESWKVSIK